MTDHDRTGSAVNTPSIWAAALGTLITAVILFVAAENTSGFLGGLELAMAGIGAIGLTIALVGAGLILTFRDSRSMLDKAGVAILIVLSGGLAWIFGVVGVRDSLELATYLLRVLPVTAGCFLFAEARVTRRLRALKVALGFFLLLLGGRLLASLT